MVAAAIPPRRRYTPQEYLDLERAAETKSEFLDGQMYAIAGGSPEHNTISINLAGESVIQLKGTPCQPFGSDQKVRIPSLELFAYPDLSVVCGEPQFHDAYGDVLLNPSVIVEVLSPSTEDYDRGTKFERYQEVEPLTDYVLIYQDQPRIDHYKREAPNQWLLTTTTGIDSEVRLESVGVTLRLRDIYNRIDFSRKGVEGSAP